MATTGSSSQLHAASSAALVTLVLLLLTSGCGDNDRDPTQPAPDVTTFEVGRFDDLPQPPRSNPLGERTDSAGVVVRSYGVTGMSPQQVLDFYVDALPAGGWVPEGPVETPGVGTYRRSWTNDGHQLTISSSPATTLGADDGATQVETQYSLNLRVGTG